MYNLAPVGRNLLQVCTSISCHLLGAEGPRGALQEAGSGSASRRRRRTASSRWSRSSASRGATARPSMMVNDKYYEPMDDGEARRAPRPASDGSPERWRRSSSSPRRHARLSVDRRRTSPTAGTPAWQKVLARRHGRPNRSPRRSRSRASAAAAAPGSRPASSGRSSPKDTKGKPVYLLCNADESEPGTFKDRLLMEKDPHQLLEGMILSSYAIALQAPPTSTSAASSTTAPAILNAAVAEAYAKGFLGENILGSGFSLDITVHRGAGAYICGEETGLIEIARGQARPAAHQAALPRRLGRLAAARRSSTTSRRSCCVKHIVDRGADWFTKHRAQREEHGAQALLRLGPRQPARRLRGRRWACR